LDLKEFLFGLRVTAIGMGVVFAALYVLQLVMNGFEAAFYKEPKEKIAPVPAEEEPAVEEGLPKTVVAAISVAVACYLGGRQANVVSIRKANEAKTAWQQAARGAAMISRRSNT
jgi:sodium pump decarboxylase gamma subunit